MKTWFLFLVVVSCTALAQISAPKQTLSVLEGRVVKDPGSLPVKKAEVTIVSESETNRTSYSAVTDAEGHFRVEGIVAGRYRVFVERAGMVEVGKRQRRSPGTAVTFEPGKDVTDLVLRMLPAAVIVGRVFDEDGDPMARADVSVLRYGYSLGRRQLETAASGTTNDLGEYRVPDLLPGQYIVVVNPMTEFSMGATTSSSAAEKQETSYVPTYFPGTTDRGQAGQLELRAGDEVTADFTFIPSPTFHVRGTLANAKPGAVLILRAKNMNASFSAAQVDKEGKFDIAHVAPGSYWLLTMSEDVEAPQISQQSLELTNSDINNLRITSLAGSRVSGHLRVQGDKAEDFSSFLIFLKASDPEADSSFVAGGEPSTVGKVKRDGSFELKNVPAGNYSVLATSNGGMAEFYLKSVSLGTTDITDSGLSLGGGGTYALDVVVRKGAAHLTGSITDSDHHPVKDAVVIAVPQGIHHPRTELYAKAVTDQQGRFDLVGLTPGDYTVFAFDSIDEGAYYDDGFLKPYEARGEKIHLDENDRKTIMLSVIPSASE